MAQSTDTKKTCFVVMGFGKKTDFETGRTLDLDKSYKNIIKPAVEDAGLTCVRADEIVHSGLIDIPMYEQLLNADVVIADLSTSNKNAYYELGVRHALRPYTTIIIAEDGIKSFPFDLNHVVIRQYHHMGDGIDFDEVMRFRKLLKDAIAEISEKDPRDKDSPVYAYLHDLSPPALDAAIRAAVQQAATLQTPADQVENQVHSVLMHQVDDAQARKDWGTAKTLLNTVVQMAKAAKKEVDPYIIQRLALLTYKSEQPTKTQSLQEARALLSALSPQTSNDTETLGLWGAVHKRLYGETKDPATLSEAVRAYERGFYLRNDYYNGINLAFLLNVRASSAADKAEAIADFVQARRVRQEVISICAQWLSDNAAVQEDKMSPQALKDYRESRYWVLATVAEAYLGTGETEKGEQQLKEANAAAPETWMKESTEEQIGKLRPLLESSPLVHIQ